MKIGWQVVHNQNLYTLMGFDNGKLEIDSDYLYENKLVLPQSVRLFWLQEKDILIFYAEDSHKNLITDNVWWTILEIKQRKSDIFIMMESHNTKQLYEISLKELNQSIFRFLNI